jgi:hypothetical protein
VNDEMKKRAPREEFSSFCLHLVAKSKDRIEPCPSRAHLNANSPHVSKIRVLARAHFAAKSQTFSGSRVATPLYCGHNAYHDGQDAGS